MACRRDPPDADFQYPADEEDTSQFHTDAQAEIVFWLKDALNFVDRWGVRNGTLPSHKGLPKVRL